MESEYENFLRNMRIESVAMIREADANPDKWYELFVNEGEDTGTHTVESGDTFSEAVERFGDYADEYGLNNLHIDIWENRANPRPVVGIPRPSEKIKEKFINSMQTIYKYPIAVVDEQILTLPRNAQILTVQMQGDVTCLWAIVDTEEKRTEQVTIWVYGTGHTIPDSRILSYIGTVQMLGGDVVFHVFREKYNAGILN